MERKILFCKIAWMKKYVGINDDDKPINKREHLDIEAIGGEAYNFLDDNGRCRGLVQVNGNIALEKHFKEAEAEDNYVDDVLVIWLAENKNKENRVVGWYKNARVYREVKELVFFNDPSANSYYNIEAAATDCYLLAEEHRSFAIDEASEVALSKGSGQPNIGAAESELTQSEIVSEVIKYIEDYKGDYENFVYDRWDIEKEIEKIAFFDDFEKLYQAGVEKIGNQRYSDALVYFKAAQKIDEPIKLLGKMVDVFFKLSRYDEVIGFLNKIIELEGETMESLVFLMCNYDYTGNREKTLEYANRIIDFPSDTEADLEEKQIAHLIIFDIYIYQGEFKKAEQILNRLQDFLRDVYKYSQEEISYIINPMKDYIKMSNR